MKYLKIKDDIALEELEKFGLYKDNFDEYHYRVLGDIDFYDLIIDSDNILNIYVALGHADCDIPDRILVVLYKLIKADIVEVWTDE